MADLPPPPPPDETPHAESSGPPPGGPGGPRSPELVEAPPTEVAGGEAGTVAGGVVAGEELAGEHEPQDRFRTFVAIAIAIVSILGAVVAFTGTLAGQTAAQLDQSGIEDTAQQEQIITDLNAQVEEDVRNLAPYQEEIKAAQVLESQAATLQSSDPSAAANLQSQAESYLVLARTRSSFFQGATPSPGPSGKPLQYDPQAALQRLENNNEQLSELRPDATIDQAEQKHTQSTNLVGLVTLFIAALLFLTLAQFARPAVRRFFALAGGIVAVIALSLWVVVLVTGG